MTYATATELRTYLGVGSEVTDARLTGALESVTAEIDQWCGRVFTMETEATARLYHAWNHTSARVDDFWTADGLVVAVDYAGDGTYLTTLATSDYQLEPLNGVVGGVSGWPYYRIRLLTRSLPCRTARPGLSVTAQWGWSAVPAPVKQACLIMAAETMKLSEAPFGVAGFDGFGAVRVRVNPMAERKLAPYRREFVLVA